MRAERSDASEGAEGSPDAVDFPLHRSFTTDSYDPRT